MTRDVLARLRALHEAATPGPWRADTRIADDVVIWAGPHGEGADLITNIGPRINEVGVACDGWAHDAELIAAMRNALPALLDVAEAARRSVGDPRSHFEGGGCPFGATCTRCTLHAALERLDVGTKALTQ